MYSKKMHPRPWFHPTSLKTFTWHAISLASYCLRHTRILMSAWFRWNLCSLDEFFFHSPSVRRRRFLFHKNLRPPFCSEIKGTLVGRQLLKPFSFNWNWPFRHPQSRCIQSFKTLIFHMNRWYATFSGTSDQVKFGLLRLCTCCKDDSKFK